MPRDPSSFQMIRYLSLLPRMTSSKDFPFQAFLCVWRHHRQDSSLSSFQSRRNHSWCVQIFCPLYRSLFFEIYEWSANEFRYLLFMDSLSGLLLSGGPWRYCDIEVTLALLPYWRLHLLYQSINRYARIHLENWNGSRSLQFVPKANKNFWCRYPYVNNANPAFCCALP